MSHERLKVLLVEHDPGFTRAVSDMLSRARDLSADLSSAPDLRTAFYELHRTRFDILVLDVAVPDGAGLGSIPLLKAERPELPIIVAGEADSETVAVEAVQAGAQDYLVKNQLTAGWLERSLRYAIERHRTDAALLAAREKYHSIFDNLVEGIFRTTPDGKYLIANQALARIYGYSSPEELMRSLTDIGQSLYVQEGRRDEFIRLMQENDTITGFESQIYRKDGTTIWISENCRAIRDAKNQLLYYEGTVEDITHRRQAEEDLRRSEALYHSLVETMPQNVFRKDLQGRFTFANQQYCKHYNCKLEDILGKTDFDFFPPELAEKYRRDDWRVMETGQTLEFVEEHQPLGQKKSYIHVVKTPLYGPDGKIIGLQGIFWDVTEQYLAEDRIRRANERLVRSRRELRKKNQQMEEDLKMAREIQLTMLPQQYPCFPHDAGPDKTAFRFTHRYLPTGAVGGDFFTVSAASDEQATVFICDVAGHGVRSALVTAMIRALLEEIKPLAHEPGQFVTQLNKDLYAILKHAGTPLLTTAFYFTANWKTGLMRYTNAGHPKPLHLRRSTGAVVPLTNATGRSQPALGLFENTAYQTSEVVLAANDLIMLFTDGLYEVQGADHELYTQERLIQDVRERVNLPASELFDTLLERIRSFSADGKFADDVCLVGMEVCRPVGSAE
ncbi:MAG TPA: SpoIIE family protein phosphatase [Verrucomicrobia bacterium]|nr:SpoIIE family protein phosphatase [Verrucomicrobiota bacterium]HOP99125.1 SpoIIE family protein phosphatase [Verrucomicrobiota bacterium]HPU55526.1 SpoIIE family protein phosphatase [Verrucomicrobiota bacterium]